jgi:hypothetical protein
MRSPPAEELQPFYATPRLAHTCLGMAPLFWILRYGSPHGFSPSSQDRLVGVRRLRSRWRGAEGTRTPDPHTARPFHHPHTTGPATLQASKHGHQRRWLALTTTAVSRRPADFCGPNQDQLKDLARMTRRIFLHSTRVRPAWARRASHPQPIQQGVRTRPALITQPTAHGPRPVGDRGRCRRAWTRGVGRGARLRIGNGRRERFVLPESQLWWTPS